MSSTHRRCSTGLAGLPPPKESVFTLAAFTLSQGTPSEQANGGKKGVWLLPLVPLSDDAEIISVAVHSTSAVGTSHFRQSITPLLKAEPLCMVLASQYQPAPNPAPKASAISVRPLRFLPARDKSGLLHSANNVIC